MSHGWDWCWALSILNRFCFSWRLSFPLTLAIGLWILAPVGQLCQTQLGKVKVFSREQLPLLRGKKHKKDKWLLLNASYLGNALQRHGNETTARNPVSTLYSISKWKNNNWQIKGILFTLYCILFCYLVRKGECTASPHVFIYANIFTNYIVGEHPFKSWFI